MKMRVLLSMIALACIAALTSPSLSQVKDGGNKTAASPALDQQEMMKRWMEASTPGEGHKTLEHFVGKWETSSRMWMEGPDKPPSETKGSSEVKWIMNGRFVQEEATGQVMGQPHKGMGITGYDNFKKRYVSYWIDNMSTAMYTMEGFLDQSGKVLTAYGRMDEPMTGEHDKMVKFVTRIISKDKHIFEIFDLVGSPGEFKAFEIVYTRKQ